MDAQASHRGRRPALFAAILGGLAVLATAATPARADDRHDDWGRRPRRVDRRDDYRSPRRDDHRGDGRGYDRDHGPGRIWAGPPRGGWGYPRPWYPPAPGCYLPPPRHCPPPWAGPWFPY